MYTRSLTLFRNCISPLMTMRSLSAEAGQQRTFETLLVHVPKPFVYHVELNRPDKRNALNKTMWTEIGTCFDELAGNKDCRAIVLSGAGRLFSSGIDLNDVTELGAALAEEEDIARRCKIIYNKIHSYQKYFTALEKCPKPVIGAIHNACIGGAMDLITATDIRYCTLDAWFQVKEVDLGMAADIGTLQRLPKIIGSSSLVRDLAFTARQMPSSEAEQCGLVSRVFKDKESMVNAAIELASEIAVKSPVAVQGTKIHLLYARDHSVEEGLDYIAHWNKTMLQSEDFMNAAMAQLTKSPPPVFSKL